MLADRLMQMPSAQQFLNALLYDLSERRSLLVLLPAGIETRDPWYALEGHLVRRDFHIEEIVLPALPTETSPTVALGKALNVQWPEDSSPRSIVNLMLSQDLPEIIHLTGFDELAEPVQRTWVAFLSDWAQVSKNLFDREATIPPALILFAPGSAFPPPIPESDLYLSIHYWWGFPSALEVQMLCRLENASGERASLLRWREHLIPSLIGNDIALAGHLWDQLSLDFDQLLPLLQSFGEQRGWTRQDLQAWDAEELLLALTHNETYPSRNPSPHWYQLWARGVLNWTPEYGTELHTAALALLERTEDLQHRLWRGQASLLLPLIDNVRLTLCRHLSRQYGHDWPVRWYQPDVAEEAAAVRDNPFACQWGHLAWLLKNCDFLREERGLRSVVDLTRWTRNQLAHYRPVTLSDFDRLWREIYQLQQKIKVDVSA